MSAELAVEVAPEDLVLSVRGLTVRTETGVRITEGVDLSVRAGEAVAVVGESGSGKSVMAKAVLGLLPPELTASGGVVIRGEVQSDIGPRRWRQLRGSEIAVVMQDPFTMLNPLRRVEDIITEKLRGSHGRRLPARERRTEAVARLAEVGISDPSVARRYPFELSGGMRQRVAIAAAIAERPSVLIADEPTTALDVTTQAEILALLDRLRRSHHMALVLITHDLRVAATVCDRVYVMYAGTVMEQLAACDLLSSARHPYTARLTASDPPVDRRLTLLPSIPGSVPSPGAWPQGCRFAQRCAWTTDACVEEEPELRATGPDHDVRCVRVEEHLALVPRPDSEVASPSAAAPDDSRDLLLRITEVSKSYGAKVAVSNASVEIREGESVGIVGESGSGKTTMARMMVGLERATSGSVDVAGVGLAGRPDRDEWARVRATAQMAFQDPSSTLNPFRTVGSTLAESLRLSHKGDIGARTDAILARVGLDESYASRRPRRLSGGERQRVAIARALARDPRLLICDEVVSALDVSVQAHILNLLNELRDSLGLAMVFITHDLAVVRQVTERLYVMQGGEVVEQGSTADVLDDPQHAYTRRLVASIPAPEGAHRG